MNNPFNRLQQNRQQQQLPKQVIQRDPAIHEQIRHETVQEVQPIVNVENLKTEIHQVTQPLIDKEIKPVTILHGSLAPETRPDIEIQSRDIRAPLDYSTTSQCSASMMVEKPPIYQGIDKTQIVEEIQPVIYKETIIPSIIQETKPIYQKIVEGPTYVQEVLPFKDISGQTHPGQSTAL